MKKIIMILSVLLFIGGCSKEKDLNINNQNNNQHYIDSLQHIQDSIIRQQYYIDSIYQDSLHNASNIIILEEQTLLGGHFDKNPGYYSTSGYSVNFLSNNYNGSTNGVPNPRNITIKFKRFGQDTTITNSLTQHSYYDTQEHYGVINPHWVYYWTGSINIQ